MSIRQSVRCWSQREIESDGKKKSVEANLNEENMEITAVNYIKQTFLSLSFDVSLTVLVNGGGNVHT
jgi:hypothetical protein